MLSKTIDNAKMNEPCLLRTFLTCFIDLFRNRFLLCHRSTIVEQKTERNFLLAATVCARRVESER